MEYRFPFSLQVSVDGLYLGIMEDLEAVALITTGEDDPYDWFLDEWRVQSCDGVIYIDPMREKDPLKEMLRCALESEWKSAVHSIEISRMLRAEADDDGEVSIPQIEQDRSAYHQAVL